MKKLFLLTILSVSAFSISAFAQFDNNSYGSSSLNRYAGELKRQTVDMVDRTNNKVSGGFAVSRADMEEAFLAAQVDASAGLFQQLIRGSRSASELRDAASFLTESARRAPTYGSNSFQWRDIQSSISSITRELGGTGDYPNGGNNPGGGFPGDGGGGPIIGRAYWRGTVDDKIQITIRNQEMSLRTIGGRETYDANYSFTSPLPNRKVRVEVNKQKGRGTVRVLQQPSRENDFTAVIEVFDDGGGAKDYQLEIYWR